MIARGTSILVLAPFIPGSAGAQQVQAPPVTSDRLGLGDLSTYAKALRGWPTTSDNQPSSRPVEVSFRDLWDHPSKYIGRRVMIRGRIERTFRQAAVGEFPPLSESWIFSRSGDPYCAVYPRPSGHLRQTTGQPVRFTGIFLRKIRYSASDGDRLAPLLVGDRPPALDTSKRADPPASHPREAGRIALSSTSLALCLLAVSAMLILTRQVQRSWRPIRIVSSRSPDPPPSLHFLDSPDPPS